MATTPTTILHSRLEQSVGAKKLRTSTWIIRVTGLLLLLATAYVVSTQLGLVDDPASQTMTREEILRDLVNRGLVPAQTLEPASPSREEKLRDLINRGLIPAQTLEPASPSQEEILRDLVNRGLIPRQALHG